METPQVLVDKYEIGDVLGRYVQISFHALLFTEEPFLLSDVLQIFEVEPILH